jgi:hypothetical protein
VFTKGEDDMPDEEKVDQKHEKGLERRGFFYTLLGGALAAMAGWLAGFFPRNEAGLGEEIGLGTAQARISTLETQAASPASGTISSSVEGRISALETQAASLASGTIPSSVEGRISALEAKLAGQTAELMRLSDTQPIAQVEGGDNELVVFNKREVSIIQQESSAVFLNLVNQDGGVGIRFYKDFGFGNEQVTNPWSIWIEGVRGYQNLAIIRDWRFTAALWDADGKLIVGKLDPYPPGNQPAKARFQVRGMVNEVQAIIEASSDQNIDIFQVNGGDNSKYFSINSAGNAVIGSPGAPKEILLHDTMDGSVYSLQVNNGRLILTKV